MRRELFSTLPFFLNDKSCQAQAVVLKASQRAKKYFRVKKSSFKIVLRHSENLKIRTFTEYPSAKEFEEESRRYFQGRAFSRKWGCLNQNSDLQPARR